MNSEELRQYIRKSKEGDYLIVDVRQPEEYVQGHIPGAKLIPVRELVADLSGLPPDKDLIFYCHSGGRSAVAATLALEEGVSSKAVYNLDDGIMGWQDRVVPGYPKVRVFDTSREISELLLVAMDLEKGALRFYDHLKQKFMSEPFSKTFERLSVEEIAHARAVYKHCKNVKKDVSSFEMVFENLKGEILEGGENLVATLRRLEEIEDNTCLNLIELALHIETSAFDLYRTMPERTDSQEARQIFLSIAQAEKTHMKRLVDAIEQCDKTKEIPRPLS